MKNGFEGISDSQLISKFVQEEKEFVVTFLDGSFYKIPVSKENYNNLINVMLEQAEARNSSNALKKAKGKRARLILAMYAEVITGCVMAVLSQVKDADIESTLAMILTGICGITFVASGIKYSVDKSEIEELQKYGIYLSIKDELDSCVDYNLFNGVASKAKILNINTLDHFTLKDIKTIKGNLERSAQLYPRFKMTPISPSQK